MQYQQVTVRAYAKVPHHDLNLPVLDFVYQPDKYNGVSDGGIVAIVVHPDGKAKAYRLEEITITTDY